MVGASLEFGSMANLKMDASFTGGRPVPEDAGVVDLAADEMEAKRNSDNMVSLAGNNWISFCPDIHILSSKDPDPLVDR